MGIELEIKVMVEASDDGQIKNFFKLLNEEENLDSVVLKEELSENIVSATSLDEGIELFLKEKVSISFGKRFVFTKCEGEWMIEFEIFRGTEASDDPNTVAVRKVIENLANLPLTSLSCDTLNEEGNRWIWFFNGETTIDFEGSKSLASPNGIVVLESLEYPNASQQKKFLNYLKESGLR